MNALAAGASPPDAGFESRLLGVLADLSQALAVSIDIEETLAQAVTRIADCMQAEAASVFLLDPASQQLVCRACAGPVDVTGLKLPPGAGIVGRTLAANAPQMVRDACPRQTFEAQRDAHAPRRGGAPEAVEDKRLSHGRDRRW